jgi:transposase InsO family protein
MRETGLTGRLVRVTRRQPGLQRFYQATDNLRRREPKPRVMNAQWVGDVTYLKAGARPCFLAVVMDVYSRKIVGWTLGMDRTVNLTARAMQQALRSRALAPGLIFHSDRGIEYGAYRYRDVLTQHGIRPSMNRPRCCQDNAHMESFFHSMKTEELYGKIFTDDQQLRQTLSSYIAFYNQQRLHSSLRYLPPAVFEQREGLQACVN